MKRVYVAGPMSGLPELNFPAFHQAAAKLRADGFEVVNPAEINGGADEIVACKEMTPEQLEAHWRACMRKDIAQVVTCEAIAVLPGWTGSRGARLEHHIATSLGMEVMDLGAP